MNRFYSFFLFIFLSVSYLHSQDTLFIHSHTVVEMGDTMLIPKNTVVMFTGSYQISVIGTLQAKGTTDEPIIFTALFDSTNAAATSWQGIALNYTDDNAVADSSIFEHCVFRYAHAYTGCGATTGFGGAVRAWGSSRVRFSHCRFENNFAQVYGGAVYLETSNIIFDHCRFENNTTDTAGTTSGGCMAIINAAPTLNRCVISKSWSSSVGGAIIAMNCDSSKIVNCEFFENSGSTGGAMFISGCSKMLFVNNLFHHNEGRYFGGAFALKSSSFRIINCTITENFGGQGGGVYCSTDVDCSAYNSIFANNEILENANGPQFYIAFQLSTINFFNCLVENGYNDFGGNGGGVDFHGTWYHVMEDEMEFESCGNGFDYCLPQNSPCINAGNMKVLPELPELDLQYHQRIINDTVDLGVFESDYETDIQEIDNKEIATVFPNPAKDMISISVTDDALIGELLSIYDMNGIVKKSFKIDKKNTTINVKFLTNGTYFLLGKDFYAKFLIIK